MEQIGALSARVAELEEQQKASQLLAKELAALNERLKDRVKALSLELSRAAEREARERALRIQAQRAERRLEGHLRAGAAKIVRLQSSSAELGAQLESARNQLGAQAEEQEHLQAAAAEAKRAEGEAQKRSAAEICQLKAKLSEQKRLLQAAVDTADKTVIQLLEAELRADGAVSRAKDATARLAEAQMRADDAAKVSDGLRAQLALRNEVDAELLKFSLYGQSSRDLIVGYQDVVGDLETRVDGLIQVRI